MARVEFPYVCCCTAYAEASYKRLAKEAGMNKFLTKPVKDSELNEILTHLSLM